MPALLPPLTLIPREIAAVSDYTAWARERVSAEAWAYFCGGSADEITLRENRAAFDRLKLNSRLLHDFSAGGSTSLTLFGQPFEHPIFLAPIAYQKLAYPDGERATALGAAASKAGFIVSTHATISLEEIAQTAQAPLWFQLYAQPDRAATRELLERAEAAGYQAIVLTADAPVNGARNAEQRAGFRLPPGIDSVNTRNWPSRSAHGLNRASLCGGILSGQPTWADLEWIRSTTKLPTLLKGVMTPADARRAMDLGLDGIIVSNHGGRTLDTLPATIDALPRIAEAVSGRIPLLLDGGIQRGTDVLKAIALGATAVLVGRAYLNGLAAAGAIGVAHVVNLLRTELEIAMALTGRASLPEIDRTVLWTS